MEALTLLMSMYSMVWKGACAREVNVPMVSKKIRKDDLENCFMGGLVKEEI
jgi:hypothetical protein